MFAAVALVSMATVLWAAELPRTAPEFTVNLTNGQKLLLSQYKGKAVVLAFILTYCPHCQKTVGFLIKDQNEYGPRGLQVLTAAIEQGAAGAVPNFVKQFNPPFPVGYAKVEPSLDFLQHPTAVIPHMPILAFIDRQGMVRAQYEGDNDQFFGDRQDQNLRGEIEKLLTSGAPAKKGVTKKTAVPSKKQS